jgi:Fe2+ transport system protein FeoA
MNLSQVKPGQKFMLQSVPDQIKMHFIRFGFKPGDSLLCVSKVPGGPVLLQKGHERCQLAIGNDFAATIPVASAS